MTVDGFAAAMWEKYAQSQGFGLFGPGRAGGGGGGWDTIESRDHIIITPAVEAKRCLPDPKAGTSSPAWWLKALRAISRGSYLRFRV